MEVLSGGCVLTGRAGKERNYIRKLDDSLQRWPYQTIR